MNIKEFIRTIPDYPKPGIQFRDITTLLGNPAGFSGAVDALVALHDGAKFDVVGGIEARGFILCGAVAHRLGLGFVPVRKKGKLPFTSIGQDYELNTHRHGRNPYRRHKGWRARAAGRRSDATGGTAEAAVTGRPAGAVAAASFVIELPGGGRGRLEADIEVLSLCAYEGH